MPIHQKEMLTNGRLFPRTDNLVCFNCLGTRAERDRQCCLYQLHYTRQIRELASTVKQSMQPTSNLSQSGYRLQQCKVNNALFPLFPLCLIDSLASTALSPLRVLFTASYNTVIKLLILIGKDFDEEQSICHTLIRLSV